MTELPMPTRKPARPFFSSGPCAKPPGYSPDKLATEVLGRSHRAKIGKDRLKAVIDRSHALLGLPAGYRLGIVPASDTGAIEKVVDDVIAANPKQVDEVKAQRAAGHEKPKTLGWFVGQIMKASGGKANPATVNALVAAKLGL